VFRIVAPVAVAAPDPIAAAVCPVAISIAVIDEVVAVVNINGVVAAPSGAITPASAPHGSHGNSHAE
jgi:hypothetical protein